MIIKMKNPGREKLLSLPAETDNMTYAIDQLDGRTVQYIDLEQIVGWAFMNGESTKGSKISVVLKSARNTYVFDSNHTTRRLDVAALYDNADLEDSGFMVVVPVALLDDGAYRVGIYIKKDKKEAFRYVDRIITKYKRTVFPFGISRTTDISLPRETHGIRYNLDALNRFTDNGFRFIALHGWAFVTGEDSIEHKIYIVLKSDETRYIFITTAQKRLDVSAHFKTGDYDDSGFKVLFPEDLLKKGKYKIGIYIKASKSEMLQYTSKIIEKE